MKIDVSREFLSRKLSGKNEKLIKIVESNDCWANLIDQFDGSKNFKIKLNPTEICHPLND